MRTEPLGFSPLPGGGKGGPPSSTPDQNPHVDGYALIRPPSLANSRSGSRASSRSATPAPGAGGPDAPSLPDSTTFGSLLGRANTTTGGSDGAPTAGDGSASGSRGEHGVSLDGLSPEAIAAQRLQQEEDDLVDQETNFWRLRNFSIPVFYFILGFALRYPTVALRRFMIAYLKVSPAMQSLVVGVVMYLPFSMKIFFAFLSDGVPILGQRRKPYMIGGVIMAAAAWITLGALDAPSVDTTAMLLFVATLGIVWTDTMVDTLVVERMRHEHGSQVGKMQTLCWMQIGRAHV